MSGVSDLSSMVFNDNSTNKKCFNQFERHSVALERRSFYIFLNTPPMFSNHVEESFLCIGYRLMTTRIDSSPFLSLQNYSRCLRIEQSWQQLLSISIITMQQSTQIKPGISYHTGLLNHKSAMDGYRYV